MSVDLRVNRISAISGHLPRLEGRRMRRGASGTPVCACLPNEGDAQRWRLIRQTVIYLQPVDFTQKQKQNKQISLSAQVSVREVLSTDKVVQIRCTVVPTRDNRLSKSQPE